MQPKLVVFSVMEMAAATASSKVQFMQSVPAYLEVTVGRWAIAEQRSLPTSSDDSPAAAQH